MRSFREVRRHVFAPLRVAPPEPEPPAAPVEPEEPPPPDPAEIAAAAWSEGYQRGYEEGLRQAQEEQKKATRKLARLAKAALVESSELIRALEQQVVELTLAVAEKVIAHEVRLDASIVTSVIRSALEEIEASSVVRVRVHPRDYELLAPTWEGILRKPLATRSELVSDDHVQAGGCVIETPVGQVDAQLSTKLQQIVNSFQALLEGEAL